MARPIKDGVDYFPLDCVLDSKWEQIELRYGLIGFAVVVKLLQRIYGGKGYYCELNDDIMLAFQVRDCGLGRDSNVVSDILCEALKRGIFDKEMYEKYRILTSKGIQERYFSAVSRREHFKVKPEYLLINYTQNKENVCNNPINVCNNPVNVCNNSQSKVNKRKVNNSIYTYIRDKYREICVSLPDVPQLSENIKGLIKDRHKEYGTDKIIQVFNSAEQSKFLSGRKTKWSASLEWILQKNHFDDILNGKYRDYADDSEPKKDSSIDIEEFMNSLLKEKKR